MSGKPAPHAPTAADAERELARLNEEISAARAFLIRLLQDVVQAETGVDDTQAGHVVQANQELVVSALRAQAEAELANQALNDVSRSAELDALTHLPNRVLLRDRLTQAITHAHRHGARLALLFLDLDNFKHINDTLGHAVGDAVLQLVAGRLASTIRAADTVGRHGGDEFLILLTEISAPEDATHIADKVLSALSAPSLVAGHVMRLTASVGISIYPDDGQDADALTVKADAAMYHAKQHGLGRATCADLAALQERAAQPGSRSVVPAPMWPLAAAQAEQAKRHAQLREANEKLVLASLDAQALQVAAELALRRQMEFMATVAGELSDPMAPIRLATAMLGRLHMDEPLLPRAQELFDRQVAQVARVVGALQDVSRSGAGDLPGERRPADLGAIVNTAVLACRPAMDMRLQHLDIHLPVQAMSLHADFNGMVQVLRNLLENATKYTPGGGRIELRLQRSAAGNAELSVADNGIGITAAALASIYEPFVQDTRAAGYNGVGPGIGLTVVRAVVEAHGGTVQASSGGAGRGSRFTVTLPLAGGSACVGAAPPTERDGQPAA